MSRKPNPSKIKWRLGEKPTGRYRSFFKRGWPSGEYSDGSPAASIDHVDGIGYEPYIKESESLVIRVANYHPNGFDWVKLKARPSGLTAAKAVAQKFINEHHEILRDRNQSIVAHFRTLNATTKA